VTIVQYRSTALAVLLSVPVLAGCGRFKRTKECNAFIDKVNTSLKRIEVQTTSAGGDEGADVATMRKLADLYQALGKDIAALQITTPELEQSATEYRQMANSAEDTARRVANAIEKKDLEQATAAQKQFDAIVKQEDQLITRINELCQK